MLGPNLPTNQARETGCKRRLKAGNGTLNLQAYATRLHSSNYLKRNGNCGGNCGRKSRQRWPKSMNRRLRRKSRAKTVVDKRLSNESTAEITADKQAQSLSLEQVVDTSRSPQRRVCAPAER